MRKSNGKFFVYKPRVQDSKPAGPNPHYGPDTAFCKKVTYVRPLKGGAACWACGNYHAGEKKAK